MTGYQGWIARPAADLPYRNPFSDRGHCASRRISRLSAAAATGVGLRSAGNYGNPYVRCQLHVTVLGRATCLIGSCCCPAGNNSDLRHDLRALDAAG